MSKLIEFYTHLLEDLDITPCDGGFLTADFGGTKIPVTVSKKRLCLPTTDILRGGNWDKRIVFHPVEEKLSRGESSVLKALKDYIQMRITTTTVLIARAILEVASDPARQVELKGGGSFLSVVGACDKNDLSHFNAVIKGVSKSPDNRLISIYLKRGSSKTTEESYTRKSVVTFPLLDELNGDGDVFGVKVPKKSKRAIAGAFEVIFGDAVARAEFSTATSKTDAPYLSSLLSSFAKLGLRINDVITPMTFIDQSIRFKLGWVGQLMELDTLMGIVPSQEGNEGGVVEEPTPPPPSVKSLDNLQRMAGDTFNRQEPTPPPAVQSPDNLQQPTRNLELPPRGLQTQSAGMVSADEFFRRNTQQQNTQPQQFGYNNYRQNHIPNAFELEYMRVQQPQQQFGRPTYQQHQQQQRNTFADYHNRGRYSAL